MKSLLFGIVVIILVGLSGLVYRNVVEHPATPIACPLDARVCPDGTALTRTGLSCTFPACPPPNITLADLNVSFALPSGVVAGELPDSSSVAAYDLASSTTLGKIVIRRYPLTASTSPLRVIHETAIGGASGQPISETSLTSTVIGNRRYTVASLERFEGQVDTAYYLVRTNDVVRFDAIDSGVTSWTNPSLDVSTLPAHTALRSLLATFQGQ